MCGRCLREGMLPEDVHSKKRSLHLPRFIDNSLYCVVIRYNKECVPPHQPKKIEFDVKHVFRVCLIAGGLFILLRMVKHKS